MEKIQESRKSQNPTNNNNSKGLVWDCGSTLYDSFELKSFERQLYSAIHSRTSSMPHLPDRTLPLAVAAAAAPLPLPPPPPSVSKKPSKISRSLHKFLKSVFKSNKQSFKDRIKGDQYYVVYDKSGALSTIPEVPEIDFGGFSPPEINSFVRRTSSERFTAAAPPTSMIGISCA